VEWKYKFFSREEVECRCGCGGVPKKELMNKLETLREYVKFPLIVSSGCRCPDYNKKVSTTGDSGPHVLGLAVDIKIHGARAFELVSLARSFGFTGIGISQKGEMEKRFIHLDCVPVGDDKIPRPTIWSY